MTNIEGREAHLRGEHTAYDGTTQEQRAQWVSECVYCARIWGHDGSFKNYDRVPTRTERNYSGGPSYPVGGPRVPQGGSYNNGGRVDKPASEKQISFIKSLLNQQDLTGTAYPNWDDAVLANLTSRQATEAIDHLKTLPRKPYRPATPAPAAEVTEDGIYQDPKTETIYKVQIAKQGSGNLYAKQLVLETDPETGEVENAHFEYAGGAIRRIRPEWKMTLEQAAKFGQLYGICCKCGADLTDEGSIARGIGPICAQNF
jgi:Family of unknown function (DUF6011)